MKFRQENLGEILQNRKNFLDKLGLDASRTVSAGAVHENKVSVVDEENIGQTIENTDGLITSASNVILTVTAADCLPIYFFGENKYTDKRKNKKIIGLAHAGWRGVAKNIVREMFKKMQAEFGMNPIDVSVKIGPHIKSCHFEIKKDVEDQFAEYKNCITREGDTVRLDLAAVVTRQLKAEGVCSEKISVSNECTYCLDKKYFSFRRDKPEKLEVMLAYNMMV